MWSFESTDEHLRDLTLVRLDARTWNPKIVDLRENGILLSKQKRYSPPVFTLDEVAELHPDSGIAVSAGFTQTLNLPVPAGLLQIGGVEHAPAFSTSRIMDGFVCIGHDGKFDIQSRIVSGARRAPSTADQCKDAVQVGPVLVFEQQAQIKTAQLLTSRVAIAVDTEGRYLLAYSTQASTSSLACVLALPVFAIRNAIGLQGDVLGGITFSASVAGSPQALGRTDQVIASAIIFQKSPPSNIPASSYGLPQSPTSKGTPAFAAAANRSQLNARQSQRNASVERDAAMSQVKSAADQRTRVIKCEDLLNSKCR